MRRGSIARPNPLDRQKADTRREARLAVLTPDTSSLPQATESGATDTGSIDGFGRWQANGRLGLDALGSGMRLSG